MNQEDQADWKGVSWHGPNGMVRPQGSKQAWSPSPPGSQNPCDNWTLRKTSCHRPAYVLITEATKSLFIDGNKNTQHSQETRWILGLWLRLLFEITIQLVRTGFNVLGLIWIATAESLCIRHCLFVEALQIINNKLNSSITMVILPVHFLFI